VLIYRCYLDLNFASTVYLEKYVAALDKAVLLFPGRKAINYGEPARLK
jgi:hypothetical protein